MGAKQKGLELCLEISGNSKAKPSKLKSCGDRKTRQDTTTMLVKENWQSLRYPNWFVMDLLEPRLQKCHRPDGLHRGGRLFRDISGDIFENLKMNAFACFCFGSKPI